MYNGGHLPQFDRLRDMLLDELLGTRHKPWLSAPASDPHTVHTLIQMLFYMLGEQGQELPPGQKLASGNDPRAEESRLDLTQPVFDTGLCELSGRALEVRLSRFSGEYSAADPSGDMTSPNHHR